MSVEHARRAMEYHIGLHQNPAISSLHPSAAADAKQPSPVVWGLNDVVWACAVWDAARGVRQVTGEDRAGVSGAAQRLSHLLMSLVRRFPSFFLLLLSLLTPLLLWCGVV
jgi:hypothetical protein